MTILVLLVTTETASAKFETNSEVLLQFRHQQVINTYIPALYHQNEFYLPASQLFDLLEIQNHYNSSQNEISGRFSDYGEYRILIDDLTAEFQHSSSTFPKNYLLIRPDGIYFHPDIFSQIFNLHFSADFSSLSLTLNTDMDLPVIARRDREQRRRQLEQSQNQLYRTYYPLQFDRNRRLFHAGFLDYNLSGNYSAQRTSFLYNTAFGAEVIGGDIQGNIHGFHSETASVLRSSNLRWRYGIRKSPYLTTITIGQTNSRGLNPVAFTGISLSNEPLEPRHIYGHTYLSGTTEADAEVELYRNQSLVGFQNADQSGRYNFELPLTYGKSSYSIRSYAPSGELIEQNRRIRIPFTFTPPGVVNYTLQAGRLDNPVSGSIDRGLMGQSSISAGLSSRITVSGSAEYFEDFHDSVPTFSGQLSTRWFSNYLLSAEVASDAFYRGSFSVLYPSSASLTAEYTHYTRMGGLYNPSRNRSDIRTNFFTPISAGPLPMFIRIAYTNERRELTSITRYRVDLNSRLGRTNLRFGYRDTQIGQPAFETTPSARLNAAITYTMGRSPTWPSILRGVFVRAQTNYIPYLQEIENSELQISRNMMNSGRFHLTGGKNFIGDFTYGRVSITIDFNAFRSNSSARTTRGNYSATQSFRGSIGLDPGNRNAFMDNRQQVGRSGVAVRMFLDHNNSGQFENGDELLYTENRTVQIEQATGRISSRNGINYISQLQPYRQYNVSVNKSSIHNPLLIPGIEQFSFVSDPNQFKTIDIPVYMTGVVDGSVLRYLNYERTGIPGLKLLIEQIDAPDGREPHRQEIRTFSDGSFYAYEIPPGDYSIAVDSSQLEYIGLQMPQKTPGFTLYAKPEGDFIEGLEIILQPENASEHMVPILSRSEIDGFIVETGEFTNQSESIRVRDELIRIAGIEFIDLFDTNSQLFRLQSKEFITPLEIQELSDVIDEIEHLQSLRIHFMGQPGGRNVPRQTEDAVRIQLGAYNSPQYAEQFIHTLESRTGIKSYLEYNSSRGFHFVYANLTYNELDLSSARQILNPVIPLHSYMISSIPYFTNGYMKTEYKVYTGIYGDRDSAKAAANQFSALSRTSPEIVELPGEDFVLYLNPNEANLESALKLQNILIENYGHTNSHIVIITRE
ncbi:hypothetical protein [Rhodohalobacter sp. SW132]|uniref:hypothetical protein n=1 Tax=Rhodohalobacter sp. SW132 TaxID=2293433 RepID=UPI0011C04DB1|nr:hypothetical protein [Rhodohalobacter sp. SW132]